MDRGAWQVTVQFSRSVSVSLWLHGLQQARLPWPSPAPRACSNSCPLSVWCHSTISSSVDPFSCLQSCPASRSFPVSQLCPSGGQSIGAIASVLPMNIQDWFPLKLTGLSSLLSRDSQEFTTVQLSPQFKNINFSMLNFLFGSTLTSIHDYWKNHSFD